MTTLALTTDETEAPVTLQIVKRPPFWIAGGIWYGEGVEDFPRGLCACCGWVAPLWSTGENASCLLCHPANKKQRQGGAALQCEMFCEDTVLLIVALRADPGGAICCPTCHSKVTEIRERRRPMETAQPLLIDVECRMPSFRGAFS